jgi:hypothetical protein
MAVVSANQLSLEKTLEELIKEFNALRSDVTSVTLESLVAAASAQIVFEGATDDANETTLTTVDPTADRTITLPDATGTVVTTGNADAGATTTTFADLDHFLINDGGTLKKMALSTALSSLPALIPSSANANAIGSASLEWSDLFLGDGSVINFGNDQDVTLTHVADTGLLLNSTMALQFNDASQFINAPSATVLDINATDEIELNATIVDLNGDLDVSGNALITGVTTHGGNVVSDTDSTDDLGTTSVRWANLFVDAITATDQITATGFTGTLDGILGSGTAAAATVTTLTASGIVSIDDLTDTSSGTTGSIHTDGGVGIAKALYVGTTAKIIGVTTHGGNVVSDTDSTDDLGTTSVRWANLFVDAITATDQITATGFTGTLDGILGSGTPAAATVTTLTASGIIKTDDTTAATSTTDGSLQTDGGLSVALDAVIGDDIILLSDAAQIAFGTNSEITLAHVHNVGLTLTHVTAGDNLPIVLQLKSEEDEILVNEVIASIEFAAGDSDGTDGATVAAGIHAIAEDTFSATANATKLVFTTGVSETADSSATAKATLSSIGDFTVAGDLVVKDGGTIGTATDPDAITIAAAGDVTISQSLIVSGNLTVSGTTTQVDTVTMNAANAVIFEGATPDNYETTLTIIDPTADRTITLPDETGTVHTSGGSIVIPNEANIGSAGDADAIAIAANGVVTFSQIPVLPANSIDSDYYVDGSIDTAHYAAGSVDAAALGDNSVTAAKIGDDVIDSQHYAAGSIDAEHMAANSIDSDSYVDGSIDAIHMSANSIDSDSYVDGSIDTEHYADDSITEAKIANDAIGAAELKSVSTLLIKNAAGTTLKTLYGAGA